MDAVEFIEEKERMCRTFNLRCKGCEIANRMEGNESCNDYIKRLPAESVAIVERWTKSHPRKTRQSEFFKMFPRIRLETDGTIGFCPNDMDEEFICPMRQLGGSKCKCGDCRKKYWLEEVDG